jgi:hypothetical protein
MKIVNGDIHTRISANQKKAKRMRGMGVWTLSTIRKRQIFVEF